MSNTAWHFSLPSESAPSCLHPEQILGSKVSPPEVFRSGEEREPLSPGNPYSKSGVSPQALSFLLAFLTCRRKFPQRRLTGRREVYSEARQNFWYSVSWTQPCISARPKFLAQSPKPWHGSCEILRPLAQELWPLAEFWQYIRGQTVCEGHVYPQRLSFSRESNRKDTESQPRRHFWCWARSSKRARRSETVEFSLDDDSDSGVGERNASQILRAVSFSFLVTPLTHQKCEWLRAWTKSSEMKQ